MATIGATIRELREERGMTQDRLGELVGLSGVQISKRDVRPPLRFIPCGVGYAVVLTVLRTCDFVRSARVWEIIVDPGQLIYPCWRPHSIQSAAIFLIFPSLDGPTGFAPVIA